MGDWRMATLAREKRKNDEHDEKSKRRGIPWWLLLLTGFALGIIFTLSVSMRGGTTTVYSSNTNPDTFFLQATQLVHQATLTAQAPLAQASLDPLFIQVTQLVGTATAEAIQNSAALANDPLAATATAIILQATQAANP